MDENIRLLVKIRGMGITQKIFAKMVGEHPTVISRVIRGRENLTESKKLKYAKVLKCAVSDIFKS